MPLIKPKNKVSNKKPTKKVSDPVGKNQPIGHPKSNSGYAEEQPVKIDISKKRKLKKI